MLTENEYQEPVSSEFIEPPGWPKVIGIISIVIAGLGLVCGGLGAASTFVMPQLMEAALEGDPMPPTMQFSSVDYALMGLGTMLTVVLLAGGILLVGRRPIARLLHLIYALGSMPIAIVNLIRQFDKQAQMDQWARDFPNNQIAQAYTQGAPGQAAGEMVGLAIGLVLGLGIPLFYFVWFAAVKTKPVQITGTEDGVY